MCYGCKPQHILHFPPAAAATCHSACALCREQACQALSLLDAAIQHLLAGARLQPPIGSGQPGSLDQLLQDSCTSQQCELSRLAATTSRLLQMISSTVRGREHQHTKQQSASYASSSQFESPAINQLIGMLHILLFPQVQGRHDKLVTIVMHMYCGACQPSRPASIEHCMVRCMCMCTSLWTVHSRPFPTSSTGGGL